MKQEITVHLRQTIFHVEQLKNVVGVGNTTAYQIEISQDEPLGTLGTVYGPYPAEPLNATPFEPIRTALARSGATWLRRALAGLLR